MKDEDAAQRPSWVPTPIDTSGIELPEALRRLIEQLAENAHDNWAELKISEGWQWGSATEPTTKRHKLLIPYAELSEQDKKSDRRLAVETLKLVLHFGFRIEPGDR